MGLTSPAGAAIPTLRSYDALFGGGVTDGEHRFVYAPKPDTLRFVDTRTEKGIDVAYEAPCTLIVASHAYAITIGCDPADERRFAVMNLATRRLSFLPKSSSPGTETTYGEIGRYWVGASNCRLRHCSRLYLNWRSGETRFRSRSRDLDSPSLSPYYAYRHDTLGLPKSGHGLYITPRGSGTRILLSHCPVYCDRPTVSGRRVTWREGKLLRGYIITTRRRCNWRIPAPPGTDLTFGISPLHTIDRVFAIVAPRDRSQAYRIYSSTWTC